MPYYKKSKRGYTMKQYAYAQRLLGATDESKKMMALNAGYAPSVANSVVNNIETRSGFNNAMSALAKDSNNLALAAMHEFKARGFKGFTNKELVGALNAIGNAWSKFNAEPREKDPNKENGNRLRTVILQQIKNQNISSPATVAPAPEVFTSMDHEKVVATVGSEEEEKEEESDLDF